MGLYTKLVNHEPIKTVGIWLDETWGRYHLHPALSDLGELHYLPVRAPIHTFSQKILPFVEKVQPDLVFCFVRSRRILPGPFYTLKTLGIPTINLSLDDAHKFFLVKNLAPAFTLNITSSLTALLLYQNAGARALYLPEGANPQIHKYVPGTVKDTDVCFVGTKYSNRGSAIAMLEQAGLNTVARGKRWAGGSVEFDYMINLFNRSKIVLGFSRTSSKSNICCIKGRDFEVPMCGAFYLCERSPELEMFFEPDKEIVFWDTIPDLVEKAYFYIKEAEIRQAIAVAGYKRSITEHKWIDRFKVIFEYLETL